MQKIRVCSRTHSNKIDNFDLMAEEPVPSTPRKSTTDTSGPVPKDLEYLKESVSASRNYIKKHVSDHLFRVYDMSTTSSEYEWDGGAERNI